KPSPNTTSPTCPPVPPGWHYRLDSTRPSATTGSPAKTIKTPTSQKSSRQPTGSLMPLTTTNSAPPPTPASKPSALAKVQPWPPPCCEYGPKHSAVSSD